MAEKKSKSIHDITSIASNQPKQERFINNNNNKKNYKTRRKAVHLLLFLIVSSLFIFRLYTSSCFYINSPNYDTLQNNLGLSPNILHPLDPTPPQEPNPPSTQKFLIKHIFHHNTDKPHGLSTHARLDIKGETLKTLEALTPSISFAGGSRKLSPWTSPLHLRNKPNYPIRRLKENSPDFVESYIHYVNTRQERGLPEIKSEDLIWIDQEIPVPNVTDKDTIVSLAIMSSNAYVDVPFTGDWQNVTSSWNNSLDFGWDSDGVRGHIFVSQDDEFGGKENDTVVIAIKGTSAAVFDDGGDTAPNDKINDNLLFSCCCARVSYLWTPVCDCYTGKTYTCNQDCLERELYKKDRYYKAVLDIYRNVTNIYPNSKIWLTGHSLGGSLASLLGRTYGVPTVTFEAPGELLPSHRLHLPMPPGVPRWREHIWHIGHTADPIYMGICNGAGSSCWVAGYAMETVCHSGLECVYDVVTDKGWHVSLMNHRIHTVIDDILLVYNETAECKVPKICKDCFDWSFVTDHDDDSREPVASSSTFVPTAPATTATSVLPPGSTGDKDNDGDEDIPKTPPIQCKRRTWYGRCIDWY